jgi:hypothetical protein
MIEPVISNQELARCLSEHDLAFPRTELSCYRKCCSQGFRNWHHGATVLHHVRLKNQFHVVRDRGNGITSIPQTRHLFVLQVH